MTSNQAFNHFVNTVFGDGFIALDEKSNNSNNIIGAIRHFYETGEYSFFSCNMKQRLQRLKNYYSKSAGDLKNIRDKINNLSTMNWQGYYSELAAYDYLNQYTYVETEISNIDKNLTLAKYDKSSRQYSSFDGRLPEYGNLTFEVKSFNDNLKNIFNNIACLAMKKCSDIKHVSFSYPHDYDYNAIQGNIAPLISEIIVASSNKTGQVSLASLPGITVRIYYEKQKVITTDHSYSSYRHAEKYKYFVLNHFDQLFENENNLLVYVLHPWMNLVVNDFSGKEAFFRSFCRRVFCELSKENRELGIIMPYKWKHVALPVSEISKRIGGILFIFDSNVETQKHFDSRNPMTIFEPYLYLNPNAYQNNKNIVFKELTRNMDFSRSLIAFDDYENDNY